MHDRVMARISTMNIPVWTGLPAALLGTVRSWAHRRARRKAASPTETQAEQQISETTFRDIRNEKSASRAESVS